jgi:hypothetical protein
MPTTAPRLSALWTRLREARGTHAARVELERELASYNTTKDLDDLHAILDRYPDSETVGIRRILAAQRS